ncbi:peptidylprolyl isomerase [soil metagenome]
MTRTATLTQLGHFALALFLSALMLVAVSARAETGTTETTTPPAAAEDDPIVLRSDALTLTRGAFDDRFRVAIANVLAQQGQPLIPEMMAQFESLRPQFLEDLAFQAALLSEAERRGLSVPDEELDERLEQAGGSFESEEDFAEALSEAGFRDLDQFRETVHESELIQRVVTDLREEVEIGDEDIAAFFEANQAQFESGEQICARHILVETLEEAEALAAELEEGADFADLAEEHSLDPGSAQRGGDLDCQPRGLFVPEFEEAAFDTPEGEVSEPVETQFGYHLIQPYDRAPAGVADLSEVEADIREQLESERLNERVTALREESGVETFEENLTPPAAEDAEAEPVDPAEPEDEQAAPSEVEPEVEEEVEPEPTPTAPAETEDEEEDSDDN